MHDRIEAIQIRSVKIAKIFADLGNVGGSSPKSQPVKQVGIQADYFMPRGMQHRSSDSADITFMTC